MNSANHSRRALARVALLAALLSACATPEKLNSEQIRERFGNYGIEIVSQDARTRRSSLYSTAEDGRTARTEALVIFENPADGPAAEIHRAVVAGASIGETFRDDGWQVQKNTVYIGEIRVHDTDNAVALRMGLTAPATLAMHVYELHLEKESDRVFYATIIEVHHPEHLSREQLLDLFTVDSAGKIGPRDIESLAALVLAGD